MDLKKKKNGEEVCYVEVVRLRVEKKKENKRRFCGCTCLHNEKRLWMCVSCLWLVC